MIEPDLSVEIPQQLGRVHFVGIGGSGMSGIARMMRERGVEVTGSDRDASYATKALEEAGIPVSIGHAAEHVDGADTIVVTSALWPDNPELVAARERGLRVLHRSQALAWLTRGSRLIAVAGAHGKTTSTGMLVTALRRLGMSPSFVNGGVIAELGTNADLGESDLFVIEADESDGSFLLYDPAAVLVTNIDTDHLDHYGSLEAFEGAFRTFVSGAREFAVTSADDRRSRDALDAVTAPPQIRFGQADDARVRILDIDTSRGPVRGELEVDGERVSLQLSIPGRHNLVNAAGVIGVLVGLGVAPVEAARAVEPFTGTKRRFDLHGVVRGVSVFDDYAHHPTEVAAVLQAARTVVGDGRIIAVQQPHLYSRTQAMADQFAKVLDRDADYTVVLDVCGAREDPIPGVTGELLVPHFEHATHVSYQPQWSGAAEQVARVAREGDYVITLGCGDVYRIIPSILDALERIPEGADGADGAS